MSYFSLKNRGVICKEFTYFPLLFGLGLDWIADKDFSKSLTTTLSKIIIIECNAIPPSPLRPVLNELNQFQYVI